MGWHAVDALDRAVSATRRFLFPFEAVRWAKLAFLALVMVGGGAGVTGAGVSGAGSSSLGIPADGVGGRSDSALAEAASLPAAAERAVGTGVERLAGLDAALLAGLAVGALLFTVALVACSFAFRLAFYDALATTEVALWGPFRDRFRQALELFVVSTVLAVAAVIPALALVLAVDPAASRMVGIPVGYLPVSSAVRTGVLGSLGGIAVATALVGAVASRLTFEFVAPVMVARNVGVIAAWQAVLGAFRGSWTEVAAYLAVHAVVAAGVRVVQAVAIAFVGGVVAAVGLLVLLLAVVPLGGVEALIETAAGMVILTTAVGCAVVAVAVATLPVRLVARTYLTAYEVSTLAGFDPDLTPLASRLSQGDGWKSVGE